MTWISPFEGEEREGTAAVKFPPETQANGQHPVPSYSTKPLGQSIMYRKDRALDILRYDHT